MKRGFLKWVQRSGQTYIANNKTIQSINSTVIRNFEDAISISDIVLSFLQNDILVLQAINHNQIISEYLLLL